MQDVSSSSLIPAIVYAWRPHIIYWSRAAASNQEVTIDNASLGLSYGTMCPAPLILSIYFVHQSLPICQSIH